MAKLISIEIRKEALKLLEKGKRHCSIARILGISSSVVYWWQSDFDRGDYSWTTRTRSKNSESIAWSAVKLYTQLKSYAAVARRFSGMRDTTVRRYVLNVEKYGIPLLPKGRGCKAKLLARIQGSSVMSKRKAKSRSSSNNALKKERDEYKIALECLLAAIQEKFEDDDEDQKKKFDF